MKLHIIVNFDPAKLQWQGVQPDDIVKAYNSYYSQFPEDAFEIAIQDPGHTVERAWIAWDSPDSNT